MDEPNAWTEGELRILREMWPGHTVKEISERIPGRTPQACLTKGLRIGLPRRPHRGGKGEPWTPEEDATVCEHYADEGIACESAVLVDQETGVMYLMTKTDNDVDVTVLLNADGTPRKQVE